MKEKITEIGIVDMEYDPSGKPRSSKFTPSVQIINTWPISEGMMGTQPDTPEEAKDQAQQVLAHWFAEVGSIEIADREEGEIKTEMLDCQKWSNGRPMLCKIRFYFELR